VGSQASRLGAASVGIEPAPSETGLCRALKDAGFMEVRWHASWRRHLEAVGVSSGDNRLRARPKENVKMVLGPLKSFASILIGKFRKQSAKPREKSMFFPVEASPEEIAILDRCRPFTMTSNERIWASMSAASYVAKNHVAGAIVECGVWRGGSSMAMLEILMMLGVNDRNFFLYDTFEGMTQPTQFDQDRSGQLAEVLLSKAPKTSNLWAMASIEDVQENLAKTGYPSQLLHFIEGDVTATLEVQENLPNEIAVLRLDTDWYESTKRELDVLFPRLVPGGVCIIDDYGHWSGAKKAVDEYLSHQKLSPLLFATDYTGRSFIKA
jgi:O-methyltransferase